MITAYHGTFRPRIEKFKPLSHFGSKEAAIERLNDLYGHDSRYKKEKQGYLYEVKLDIKNPVMMKDYPNISDPPSSFKKIEIWSKELMKNASIKNYKGVNPINKRPDTGTGILNHFYNLTNKGYWAESFRPEQYLKLYLETLEKMGVKGFKYINTIEDKG